jgi:hypothetical protein
MRAFTEVELESKLMWHRKYLDNILTRSGPFTDPDAALGENTIEMLSSSKIL